MTEGSFESPFDGGDDDVKIVEGGGWWWGRAHLGVVKKEGRDEGEDSDKTRRRDGRDLIACWGWSHEQHTQQV